MGKYILIFLIVFVALFSVYNYQVDISSEVNNKNSQYSGYLSAAAHDAAKVIKDSAESSGNITALSTNEVRKKVADTFFNSLAMDFGYTSNEDLTKLHIYVPVLALIDTDGYYICYNEEHSDGNVVTLGSMITAENTWTKNTGSFLIRYYLGNNVDVTDLRTDSKTAGLRISGNYRDVYRKLGCPAELFQYGFSSTMNGYALPEGEVLQNAARLYGEQTYAAETELAAAEKAKAVKGDYDSQYDYIFNRYKREVIIRDMQEKIEYYINQHNKVAMDYHVDYKFTMPVTTEDDWTRMIENPTCIGFLQGVRVSNARDYLNIFAIGGGDISKTSTVVFKKGTKRTYTIADASNAEKNPDGYVPGERSVTKEGGEVVYVQTGEEGYTDDAVNGEIYYHTHTGDSINGGGCYTIPVFHTHDKNCYTVEKHHHVNSAGAKTLITRNMLEPHYNIVSVTTGTPVEITGKPSLTPAENGVSKDLKDNSTVSGCYTIPVYHKHREDCYETVTHKHFYLDKNGNKVYPDTSVEYYLQEEEVFWDGTLITKGKVYSGLSEARKKWIINSKHYYPDLNYDGEIKNTGIKDAHGLDEEDYLGCFGGAVQHVHTAQCYAEKDIKKTKKEKENIYHEHINPDYYYITSNGEGGTGITKEYTQDATFKATEKGFYIFEAWGNKYEKKTETVKGSFAASKVYLDEGEVVYIRINKTSTDGLKGNLCTYITKDPSSTPDDSEDNYILAAGGDISGASYCSEGQDSYTMENINNGNARVVITQVKQTTLAEAQSANATILFADTKVVRTDATGREVHVCYKALYAGPEKREQAAYYLAAKKAGNIQEMNGYLAELDIKYEYKPGFIYLGLSDPVCGKNENTVIGERTVVKEYSAKESQLECHEVYLGFTLNCGMQLNDIEGRICKCGRSDGTDKDAAGNKIAASIDGWALGCSLEENEEVQGVLTCTKNTKEDADNHIKSLKDTGKTQSEAKAAVYELYKNNGSFEGWQLGCGLNEGQRISRAEWEAAGGH